MDLEDKIDIVKSILKDKKVAIGFSGGADSTLIAYLSSKVAADTLAINAQLSICCVSSAILSSRPYAFIYAVI